MRGVYIMTDLVATVCYILYGVALTLILWVIVDATSDLFKGDEDD